MARAISSFVVLASAIALAACSVDAPPPTPGRLSQKAIAFQVNGYQVNRPRPELGWIDTLLEVEAGDTLTVHCRGGSIEPWGFGPQYGCVGSTAPWHEAIAPGCVFGSLVAKIGEGEGTTLCLGSDAVVTVPASGPLYLGFNDGVSFQDNAGAWSVDIEIDGAEPEWEATSYQGCPAWRWTEHPALLVVLTDDACLPTAGLAPGLYFVHGTDVHAIDVGGTLFAPILSVKAPASGDALVSSVGSLTLQAQSLIDPHCGAGQHYNQPYIEVSPRLVSGGVEITTTIEGMTYVALPPAGTISIEARQQIVDDDVPACSGTPPRQAFTLDAAALINGTMTWYCGLASFTAATTALGTVKFLVLSPAELPAVHFQPRLDTPGAPWVEFDVDHSCLPEAPELRVITLVP